MRTHPKRMSDTIRVHNPLPWPVIFTSEGHQLDGNSSAQGNLSDPVTKGLVDSERVIIPSEAKPRYPIPLKPTKPAKTKEATDE